jgi:hypothetical protein
MLWLVKYLSGFKWSQLRESEAHEQAMRQQMLEASIRQSQKLNNEYQRSIEWGPSVKPQKNFEQKKVRGYKKEKLTQSSGQLSIFKKQNDGPDEFFMK